jgi:hypothetical protein
MRKLFTQILPCGILPALNQYISQASELGIFENQYCLGCRLGDIPETLLAAIDFEQLSQILPMLTSQSFFQTLTTRVVESMLLRMARGLSMEYVCICIRLLEVSKLIIRSQL